MQGRCLYSCNLGHIHVFEITIVTHSFKYSLSNFHGNIETNRPQSAWSMTLYYVKLQLSVTRKWRNLNEGVLRSYLFMKSSESPYLCQRITLLLRVVFGAHLLLSSYVQESCSINLQLVWEAHHKLPSFDVALKISIVITVTNFLQLSWFLKLGMPQIGLH